MRQGTDNPGGLSWIFSKGLIVFGDFRASQEESVAFPSLLDVKKLSYLQHAQRSQKSLARFTYVFLRLSSSILTQGV